MRKQIIVNGNFVWVAQDKLSYNEILFICNKPEGLYTIIYRCDTAEGTICPRDSVAVVEGMVINCGYTGNA